MDGIICCKNCKFFAVVYRNSGKHSLYCNKKEIGLNIHRLGGCSDYKNKREVRNGTEIQSGKRAVETL